MADISKIKLPNGDEYNLKDSRISGIYSVIGTNTAASAIWTGNLDVDELYDGLTIAYYVPYGGKSGSKVFLNLTLQNGVETGNIKCYISGTTDFETAYAAGSTVVLTYYAAGHISISGTPTTIDSWRRCDHFIANSNTIGEYAGALCAGPNGMAKYSLVSKVPAYATGATTGYVVGQALDRWESLVLTSGTAATKTKNTSGFMPDAPVLYQNGGTYAAEASCAYSASWFSAYNVDTRYSFNVSSTWSAATRPLFIVGTIINGLFYLATPWWSDKYPATNDGLYYKFVGIMADKYRFVLTPIQPIYYYDNGLKVYNSMNAATVNYHTVAADVPADAVFTDTTYSLATTSADGLMSSADKLKLSRIGGSYDSTTETITLNLDGSQIEHYVSDAYFSTALLACLRNVAWVNNQGQFYYNTMHDALYENVSYFITAIFTQPQTTIYTNDALDTLKSNLVVTYYSPSNISGTVLADSAYTLIGTLTEGTSVITASYQGLTDTFGVTGVVDGFYNTWEWSSSSPTISTEFYSITSPPANTQRKLKLAVPSTATRHVFVSNKGYVEYYKSDDDTLALGFYPIPVPPTATGFTITLNDQTQRVVGYLFKHVGGQLCETINLSDATWHTGIHVSTGFQADNNLFLGVCIAHDGGVTPSSLTILFS